MEGPIEGLYVVNGRTELRVRQGRRSYFESSTFLLEKLSG
jgi:hypothetical protein